jgi:hypothetical protein
VKHKIRPTETLVRRAFMAVLSALRLGRLLAWWDRRGWVTLRLVPGLPTVTVSNVAEGATYAVQVGDDRVEVVARWWDTRRSIARKLERQLRRKGWA